MGQPVGGAGGEAAAAPRELLELVQFLGAARADVRAQAAELVAGLTGSDEGRAQLMLARAPLLKALVQRLGEGAVAAHCGAALANLACEEGVPAELARLGVIDVATETLLDPECARAHAAVVKLVANVSHAEEAAAQMWDTNGRNARHLVRLLAREPDAADEEGDALCHVATALCNLAQHLEGRRLLLSGGADLLLQALPQMGMVGRACAARRRGLAMALHNCCHAAEDAAETGMPALLAEAAPALVARAMLALASGRAHPPADVARMSPLLQRELCAARAREPDAETRALAAAALLRLIKTPAGGEAAWMGGAGPRVLEKAYEDEADDEVLGVMDEIADYQVSTGSVESVG